MEQFKDKYDFGSTNNTLFENEVDHNPVNGVNTYPYNNYNDVIKGQLKQHTDDRTNPHEVTATQVGAISYKEDQTDGEEPDLDVDGQRIAKKNIGLDQVKNTGDTDLVKAGDDRKFTSNGAYLLKMDILNSIMNDGQVTTKSIANLENKLDRLIQQLVDKNVISLESGDQN